MFDNLREAFKWARKTYPDCSFSVREQTGSDPTILSIKAKDGTLRTVVYIRSSRKDDARQKTV